MFHMEAAVNKRTPAPSLKSSASFRCHAICNDISKAIPDQFPGAVLHLPRSLSGASSAPFSDVAHRNGLQLMRSGRFEITDVRRLSKSRVLHLPRSTVRITREGGSTPRQNLCVHRLGGRWCGLHRRHGSAASRQDGPTVRPIHAPSTWGDVPTSVHLRARSPTQRGRREVSMPVSGVDPDPGRRHDGGALSTSVTP
jgi:hypothetical protein